jgi:signal transduction histidine kinase
MLETLNQKFEKDETSKRLDQMLQLDRLKNDFLSVAQHQLRTPLSGVKWALEMLKSESTIPAESMSLIDAGLERLKDSIGIINKMLKTIEADGEGLVLKTEDTDIVGLTRSIIAELNFITLKKGIKLSFIAPQFLVIKSDKDKMKAALINIIDNAIKYSPKGKVDVTITEGRDSITIVTKDTGIGIAPADIPYAFDRLHRGKNAVQVEPDESGVGLYTSKKMIELHGGSITLFSELNKGTTITVVLPK